MSKNPAYDFDFLKNQSLDDHTAVDESLPDRPNFRIVRCCGNCNYAWYQPGKARRGYCKQPFPEKKALNTKAGEKYNVHDIKTNWLHTHTTNVCEKHKFQSKYQSIGIVSKWTKVIFNADGSPANEEDL